MLIAMLNQIIKLVLVLGFSFNSLQAYAESKEPSGYNQPPKNILDIMRAPSPPSPFISPTKDRILLVATQDFPSIEHVARPFLRLAGVRLEPQNHSRHDTPGGYGIPACVRSFSLIKISDGSEKKIDLKKVTCANWPTWNATGKHFFFTNTTEKSVELWIGDAQTARVSKIPSVALNPMFGYEAQWMPDQNRILVKLVPKNLGPVPKVKNAPVGPSIQESNGQAGQSSTYEKRDTLNNTNDEKLFDYYGRSQLAVVDIRNSQVKLLAKPAMYENLDVAPDGRHLLAVQIVRPYSYIVTYYRFPKKVEVIDISNSKLERSLIAELPLADRVPIHGEPLGPRDFMWNPHEPATLVWTEALDGGDWNVKVPERDKVMKQSAPFKSAPTEMLRTTQRFSGMNWLEQRPNALVYEYDHNKLWFRTLLVNWDDPQQEKKVLYDLSVDDAYANPGNPVMVTLKTGSRVIRQRENSIFMSGTGSSPDGDRPFLDQFDFKTLKTIRLFRSDKTSYETFVSFKDDNEKEFLTRYQSPDDIPNVFTRTLGAEIKAASGEALFESSKVALTRIQDPVPEVRQIKKKLVKYKRADGVDLSFTLFTPPGYKEGTRVPTILYAYPLDYADASKASQVKGSQYTYTRLRGFRLLLMAGYAIIDNASFPIVGDPKKAYDNYTEQLVADAKAAVDQAVRMGVADPERIGVTGHSHGALMTVNLLAHSNLFKAGVATSGAYNKTLTPFGFQSERRSVWEAPDVYTKVSPFFYADKIKTPLLIMHGDDDANPGTTPMQSSFLYEAIRGNGGTVRLVMLPYEPHWYSARESNEQLVYEMLRWFDLYVKKK